MGRYPSSRPSSATTDLEALAAQARLDQASAIMEQLEVLVGDLLQQVEGLLIETLRQWAEGVSGQRDDR